MPSVAPSLAARTKASPTVVLSFFLVFLCGAALGAVVTKYAHHLGGSTDPKMITLEHWKRELNLTDQQTAQVKDLLDDFSRYYDNVIADGKTRVMQILNEDQKQKFQRMLKEKH